MHPFFASGAEAAYNQTKGGAIIDIRIVRDGPIRLRVLTFMWDFRLANS